MLNEVIRLTPSFYGISLVPKESWVKYGQALLTITGSDGSISEEEMDWLARHCAESIGASEDVIQEWKSFDFHSGDLQDIFSEINTLGTVNFNRLLIYDAVRMSSADGNYSDDEREKVSEAAYLLKVRQEDVLSIEALTEMEAALDKMRLNIF